MPKGADDVIVNALKVIAKGAGHAVLEDADAWYWNADADCAAFSYKRDFASLWGLSGDGFSKIAEALRRRSKEYTFVVVWDGIPEAETIAVSRLRFPRIFVFQPDGIMPPISAHADV